MEKTKKNILPGAALAALAAAVIIFCVLLNVEKNVMTAYEKGCILTAREDIPKGVVLDSQNISQYFEEKEMDKSLIPAAAIVDKDVLEQQMTASELDKGTIITSAMFTDLEKMTDEMHDPVIAGFKADDLYQVVSGRLRSGDHIHIYTVDPNSGNTYLVWNNVYVKDVFDGSGSVIVPGDVVTAAQRVNILLEKGNIEQFYSELSRGSLRVVKVVE